MTRRDQWRVAWRVFYEARKSLNCGPIAFAKKLRADDVEAWDAIWDAMDNIAPFAGIDWENVDWENIMEIILLIMQMFAMV